MLLDLYFLLVVSDADGNVTEIIVTLDLLEHAERVAIADFGVALETLETSIVIELLDLAQDATDGDYQILSTPIDAQVATALATGTETVTILDRSVVVEASENEVSISIQEPTLTIEIDDDDVTQTAVEVIDR